jgi:superfamily II DNA helicase RecQ
MSLAASLRTHFGFDSFRAGQEEALRSLLRFPNCHPGDVTQVYDLRY